MEMVVLRPMTGERTSTDTFPFVSPLILAAPCSLAPASVFPLLMVASAAHPPDVISLGQVGG